MHHDNVAASLRICRWGRQNARALGFSVLEGFQQFICVRHIKVPARILLLRLQENIAVGHWRWRLRVVEWHIHDVIDAQHIHRQTLQTIGQFARHRIAILSADLLEIGELADFHAVAPNLPAKTPSAERRGFPVVFHEADVVQVHIDADGFERTQI